MMSQHRLISISDDKILRHATEYSVFFLDEDEIGIRILNFSKRYGWHFPELGKIITDNLAFVRTVELMGTRENAKSIDLSDVLPEEVEEKVKTSSF